MCLDFTAYYGKKGEDVTAAMHQALAFAVWVTLPEILEGSTQQGSDFARHAMDVVKYRTWLSMEIGYADMMSLDDGTFREQFEREWEVLKGYKDELYGFRVVPKLSFEALERYQKLPRGNREIRRTISEYLSHQAKEYPHLAKPWIKDFTNLAFERRLRRTYAPLVEKIAREACDRQSEGKQPLPEQVRSAILKDAWEAYDAAWGEYRFC